MHGSAEINHGHVCHFAGHSIVVLILCLFVLGQNHLHAQTKGCVDGKCKNKDGTFIYDNGDKYVGEWKNSMREGYGKMYFANRDVYEGNWLADMRSGTGVLTMHFGHTYSGNWLDDKYHGKGIYTKQENYIYDGNWENGNKSGYGEEKISWRDNYAGEWLQNKKHGKGKLVKNSGETYEGDWNNGEQEGYGVYTWPNGDKYEGQFRQGRFEGNGKWTGIKGTQYNGDWSDGKKNGVGVFILAEGHRYVGEVKDDAIHGQGIITYADGKVYEGSFLKGKKSGYGSVKAVNGASYKGNWLDDKFHGDGMYIDEKGKVLNGKWQFGVYINENPVQRLDLSFSKYQYPYRIGEFKALIVDGTNLVSYGNCPTFPPGGGSRIGNHWFTSDLNSGVSSVLDIESLSSYVYKNNNPIKHRNKVYSSDISRVYSSGGYNEQLYLLETRVKAGKTLERRKQVFPMKFEMRTHGVVETFQINQFATGSGLILFSAASTYTHKQQLFIGSIENNKLINIDLTVLDNRFKYAPNYVGYYQGYLQGKECNSNWSPYAVFQHEDVITSFVAMTLRDHGGTALKAVQYNTTTKVTTLSNTDFNIGLGFSKYHNQSTLGGEIYFLAETGGFINVMCGDSEKPFNISDVSRTMVNHNFQLSYFDKNLNKLNQITLDNFTFITYVREVGNYIVVGGYSKTKGYVGYPNPVVTVLKKENLTATYTKFFALKNGTVDLIRSDDTFIYVAISGYFHSDDEQKNPVKPCLIVDRLNDKGVFENDLFE